jgi:LacI family transcriptional regulator
MAATIYEVAALAGVSPATVSRVLNGHPVSAGYAQRVRDAAETLQFRPNRTARNLRRQSSEMIALIIPDIENPFFTSLARGVEDRALASGYSVVLCNADERPDKEDRYLEMAASSHVAGVVLVPSPGATHVGTLRERGIPVVAVDRMPHGARVDAVLMDDEDAARRATARLFDQGHRRVACITGPAGVDTAVQRAEGWRAVVRERGGADGGRPDRLLRHADYRVTGGRAAMAELLALPEPPDAVFVANNLMSLGALQLLGELGLRPPALGLASLGELPFLLGEDVGIVVEPWPGHALGEEAARLLLERIAGDPSPPRTVVLRSAELAAGQPGT